MSYEGDKKKLLDARSTIAELEEKVLAQAVELGEAYILNAWYYHCEYNWPFLTLEEAVDRAMDDCSPTKITGPGGGVYDPYGEPLRQERGEAN